MNVSEQWLREWIALNDDTAELAEKLTMAGLEVDEIVSESLGFSDVIIGKINAIKAHPNNDRLKLCQVSTNHERCYTVVCDADNLRVGLHVALALEGATLANDVVIQPKKIHGVHSEGVLCSALELGLSEEATGILKLRDDVTPGDQLRELSSPSDQIIKLSLTPNRGDCLSIRGVARELSAITGCRLGSGPPDTPDEHETIASGPIRAIAVKEPAVCPRYIGQIIEGVNPVSLSPLWLTEKLRRSGLRSVSPIIDITNYVMLELGQPLHAFDNDKLRGTVCVRYAEQGERIEVLNGRACMLDADTLTIADEQEVLAIAGIMGGQSSAVTSETRTIFLECAYFDPQVIRGKARRYGLHSDSSHRFERGVDFELQKKAITRASQLIVDICGGQRGPSVEAVCEVSLPTPPTLHLRYDQIERILGITLTTNEVEKILSSLGMQVESVNAGWLVTIPSFRFDLAIEADLIEEIARIYGYHKIKKQYPGARLHIYQDNETHAYIKAISRLLVARGFQEVITYSFVDPDQQKILSPNDESIMLLNPISPELSAMRNSLIPGLVGALLYNQKRQQNDMRLFETGLVFKKRAGEVSQIMTVAGVMTGDLHMAQWDVENRQGDFFDLKRDVEALLEFNGHGGAINFNATRHPNWYPGQAAEIVWGGKMIGYIGTLHPSVQKALKLARETVVFELEVSGISKQLVVNYKKISKFPSIHRDLSITVDADVPVGEIITLIRQMAPDLLYNLELFDLYCGETIDLGKKSVALGLTFQQTSSTLTYDQVESVMAEIIESLAKAFGASLRG